MAEAAFTLGARRVLVVSGTIDGADGKAFDEVSLFGPTDVIEVSAEGTRRFRWTPEDFGLAMRPAADLAALGVDGPQGSAAAIRGVLDGAGGPCREIVVLNAAAVLWAAGKAGDPAAAAGLAAAAIDSGAATATLASLAAASRA
jgi:anthranilate phosphoribosyltransferase